MPLQNVANYIGQPGYQHPVENDRMLIENIFGRREGVLGQGDFAVTQSAAGLAVRVAGGATVIKGKENATQGSYFAWSSGPEDVAWPGPSASTRWDALIIRVVDPQYRAGDTPGCFWDVIQGTPGSGAPPTDAEINTNFYLPGAWQRILDQKVDPTDTAQIQVSKAVDRRKFGLSSSGNILVWSESVLPATGNEVGQGAWTLDTKKFYQWNGSKWERFVSGDEVGLGRIAYAESSTAINTGSTGGEVNTGLTLAATFKAGRKYFLRLKGRFTTVGAGATYVRFRLLKNDGTAIGPLIYNDWVGAQAGNTAQQVESTGYFLPATDQTFTMKASIQGSANSTAASTSGYHYIEVFDMGLA